MPQYRVAPLRTLADELAFTPAGVRAKQLAAAETLLHEVDPEKTYPLDFVTFRITGYQPKTAVGIEDAFGNRTGTDLIPGLALQHDLGSLIESVSETLHLVAAQAGEPVLMIDDLVDRLGITSKTVQRWRRRGLPARRFTFADGKHRVGFLLSHVERYLRSHDEPINRPASIAALPADGEATLLRRARQLALAGYWPDEIARRLAARMGRSPLTILHTLRKHDADHADAAMLPLAGTAPTPRERQRVTRGRRRGESLAAIGGELGRSRGAVYRILMDARVARLTARRVAFIDDSLFHQPRAAQVLQAMVRQDAELADAAEHARVPRDLPQPLQSLYRTPMLSAGRERALFLQFNFHRYRFVRARRHLEPQFARRRQLAVLQRQLRRATRVRNEIARANMRLVVSVARKHLRPGLSLMELVSDGSLTLLRAIDGFDIRRGNKFSTYATLALMKGFARSVPTMLADQRRAGTSDAVHALPDTRLADAMTRHADARDELASLFKHLDLAEREVLHARFGLHAAGHPRHTTIEHVSALLGLSVRRVRSLEQAAMAKLRAMVDGR